MITVYGINHNDNQCGVIGSFPNEQEAREHLYVNCALTPGELDRLLSEGELTYEGVIEYTYKLEKGAPNE